MKGHDFVNMLAGWGLCVSTYANLGKWVYGTAGMMDATQAIVGLGDVFERTSSLEAFD